MKKNILQISLALFMVFGFTTNALAQQESRDNDSSGPPLPPGHGSETDEIPAGSIGGGLALLLALGGAYGAKKVYDARKRLNK